jgi:hypothetical protein
MGKKKVEEIVQAVMAEEIAPVVEEPVIIMEDTVDAVIETPVIDSTKEVEEIVEPEIEDDVLIEDRVVEQKPMLPIGTEVKVIPGAKYTSGLEVSDNVLSSKLYIRKVVGNEYQVGLRMVGRILGTLKADDVITYAAPTTVSTVDNIKPYKVLIAVETVDIKSRPDADSKTLKTIMYDGLFTVVGEKDGWAHLKIGGWIPLDAVIKL